VEAASVQPTPRRPVIFDGQRSDVNGDV